MTSHSESHPYNTPAGRWAGAGPYYAMFPIQFANRVISEHTAPGDGVLDPFAGRGTTIFSAAVQGRIGIGIEINPVGWVYGQAKLHAAIRADVEQRIRWLGKASRQYRGQAEALPAFFRSCFTPRVSEFLLAARELLEWKRRRIDWTTMALILIDLHGKRDNALSNQMRQTKAMSPHYAVRWWRTHGQSPPDVNPVDFMLKKIAWRYAKGIPDVHGSKLYLGDSLNVLNRLARSFEDRKSNRIKLLLTSPPYYGVTNYFYDQWLRLWLLGGPPIPRSSGTDNKRKFENRIQYISLLQSVFERSACLLTRNAVVYVRTDARKFTQESTLQALQRAFPTKKLRKRTRSSPSFTQTSLFGAPIRSRGEIDLVLW